MLKPPHSQYRVAFRKLCLQHPGVGCGSSRGCHSAGRDDAGETGQLQYVGTDAIAEPISGTLFGQIEIDDLTADREFVGQEWFSYLKADPPTPIRIRIRENHCLFDGHCTLKAKTLFAHLQPTQQEVLHKRRRLWGHWLYVAAMRLDDGSLLIVVTQFKPKRAIADYANRWGIETLFSMFKRRGFCLEATHLQAAQRGSKLLTPLTLALG